MKSSRSFVFTFGLIIGVIGVVLFILNNELWFEMSLFWGSLGIVMIGVFFLGMSVNNNQAGEYRLFSDMKPGSVFQIGMFRQEKDEVHMLITCLGQPYKYYYTSASAAKFLNGFSGGVWYVYRNNKIYRDLTRSPMP